MKKVRKLLVTFLVAVILTGIFPTMPVYAGGNVAVSLSKSTVNIGDTVTVTATPSGPGGEKVNAFLTFTFDSSKLSFVSCSEGSNYGGGGGGTVTVTGVESASITLKATAAGSASVSVAGTDLVASADGTTEYGEASAGGATITVNNSASTSTGEGSTGNSDGTSSNANLSGDNSLKSLTISPGTISPTFKYNTTNYTASVGSDVTSIAVSAETSNEKATIESVTGNENLVEGKNTIKIVVKAENGVTATYTIVVTKGGAASEEPEEEEVIDEETPEENTVSSGIVVNEVAYNISEDFTEDEIPEDFSTTTINYQGIDYKGVAFDKGNVVMLYLVPEEGEEEGKFFVYDSNRGSLYSYVRISYGERYLIALLPPQETVIPATYAEAQLDLEETGVITAYQEVTEEETISEFFLFYAINSDGTEGWYQYDSLEGTFQRLNGELEAEEEETDTTDLEYLQNQYNELSEQYTAEKAKMRKIVAVLIVICVILVIIIINLLLRGGGKGNPDDDEDELEENEEILPKEEKEVEVIDTSRRKEDIFKEKDDSLDDSLDDRLDDNSDEEFVEEAEEKEEPVTKQKKNRNKKPETEDDIEILDLNDL